MSWVAVGTTVVSAAGAYLSRPDAPETAQLESVDLGKASQEAFALNTANAPQAKALAADTNTFNQNEANRLLEIAVPGFSKLAASLTGSAQSDIDNQYNLPPEIEANLRRKAAEGGITRGTSGGFESFNLLRDFGFNMVDYANSKRVSALNTLSTLTGISPKVNPMSPMSMFFTPQGVADFRAREAETQQGIQQGAYNAETAVSNYNNALMGDAAILAGTAITGSVSDAWKNRTPKDPTVNDQGGNILRAQPTGSSTYNPYAVHSGG